jgi:hypothetical protein
MRSTLVQRSDVKQGILGRVLRRAHVEGFAVAIENFLLAHDSFDALDDTAISDIMYHNRMDSLDDVELYTRDLIVRLALGFSPDEFGEQAEAQLRNLATRLKVPSDSVTDALAQSADRLYRAAISEFASDKILSEKEHAEIGELRQKLNISDRQNITAFEAVLHPIIQEVLRSALEDSRLSPTEESEILQAASRLGVEIDLPPDSLLVLERARTLWQIENGKLPVVGSPVNLQKGEVCHAWLTAEATETRHRTSSIAYSGPSLRIRIMQGVYYNVAKFNVSRESEGYRHSFGFGTLCVTNKRLIFNGDMKSYSLLWKNVLECIGYLDGVEIHKANGKPVVFLFSSDHPNFMPILNRAMIDAP